LAILATEFVVEIVGKGHLIRFHKLHAAQSLFFERFSNAEASFGMFFQQFASDSAPGCLLGLALLVFLV